MPASYRFSAEKAVSAVRYMAGQASNLDLHTALKACYFSDKSHLNEHYQPIFGATYRAMKYGPVPLEIYELIKGENIWLSELKIDRLPWRLEGYKITGNDRPNSMPRDFAESEWEHFLEGFKKSRSLNFTSRTSATHGPDWQAANGGIMKYEDMIYERPDKKEVIEYLQETASRVRL